MKDPLLSLAPDELRTIAEAVTAGRLTPPFSALKLDRFMSNSAALSVSNALNTLCADGMPLSALSSSLNLIASALEERTSIGDAVDLVTTGPEVGGVANRNTGVVVGEMFRTASESVILAGYAIYQGQRIFRCLAERMKEVPLLSVRMFLDIPRPKGGETLENVLARFAHEFKVVHWPNGMPLPTVYCCTTLFGDGDIKPGSLHAKCVVVDKKRVFVSSANFTEAAQERNLEVGVLINSDVIANRLASFFECALDKHIFKRVV